MTVPPPKKKGTFRDRVVTVIRELRGGTLTPGRAAGSVGVGLFVAMIPLVGLQFALVLAICLPLRLDSAVAYIASHVSNPLTFPFMVALELEVGSRLLSGRHAPRTWEGAKALGLWSAVGQITVGALLLGVASGMVGSVVVWFIARKVQDSRLHERAAARAKTLARYPVELPRVRHYVKAKLSTDPALNQLADLGPLGRVVDVGSGFGQIALGLLDLGRATSVFGFDADEFRVRVAQRAADGDAQFTVSSAEEAIIPDADTVLFMDCLHYMDVGTQDAVLARAAGALPSGGRIVIREVEVRGGPRSRLTRYVERKAVRRTRGKEPGFRRSTELAETLSRLGFSTDVRVPEDFSVFDNVLVVGSKEEPPSPAK